MASTHIKDNVDLVEIGERKIYIVGTAHVSQSSADLVESIIHEIQPQTVAVELCESRFQSFQDPDRWKNTDILSVLKQGKGYVLLAQLLLAGFQKKLGGKLKVKPGAEMLKAIEVGKAHGAYIALADRDVRTTLKRTWASLSYSSLFKLLWSAFGGLFSQSNIDEKEIERLKSADALEELMRDFTAAFPEVRRTLIEERDQYLAMKVKRAPGDTVVAVVGAGHVPGMLKWIHEEVSLAPLEIIPKKRWSRRLISWAIPCAVIAMLIYGFINLGAQASMHMVSTWFWVNGLFAAFGALLALGHPLSILSAFVLGPFSMLHPGWVAGVVEAVIRKPRVADLEAIADDTMSVRGWWRNRVSKVLLIMALTNLTGRLGAVVGTYLVAKQL